MKLINDSDLEDGVEFIKGLYEHWERDYYIECQNLNPGKYMAFVEMDWHESVQAKDKCFNLTTYGSG